MKIAIIGAGFTGLSAAYYLEKSGHEVTLFEKDSKPGGLAIGYKEKEWKWGLEEHYHHWFTNDKSVLKLAREISHEVIIKRPKTSSFLNGKIYQLDSPTSLLALPELTFIEKIRTGATIASLRYNKFWKPLENFTAIPFLKAGMGEKAYKKIWEPLMVNKLGKYADVVSLAWFWARIYKRTPSLAYPEGGFLEFATHLEKEIEKSGGRFLYNTQVLDITSDPKNTVTYIKGGKKETKNFDATIVTVPTFIFLQIAKQLPKAFAQQYSGLIGIGAVNIVLRLKDKFFKDNTYWLNMCDIASPILAIVEHTNFMDRKKYNNETLLYVGNYMDPADERFSMTKDQLLNLYHPWLSKINQNYKKSIISTSLFKAPFAQPIVTTKYSKKIPPIKTPLKNIYLANIQQVYPWDRGTNYAVELGHKVCEIINEEKA